MLGRRDPVVSISGQLVSLTEVRQLLEEHPFVAQVEVVALPDERRGQSLCACVVLEDKVEPSEALAGELRGHVHDTLGGLARPRSSPSSTGSPRTSTPSPAGGHCGLLCAADPSETFTVTETQLAAAASAID